MERFQNKLAVVTGASAGIGAAIAKILLDKGMKVVGLARRKELIEDMARTYPGRLFALKVDLTKHQEIVDAFQWIQNNLGEIHVLINNAGVNPLKPIETADTSHWRCIVDTNIVALGACSSEAIKSMVANNVNGIVINLNSVAGRYIINWPGLASYQASKFAVTAFSESLRLEMAKGERNIKITSLCPGLVETQMAAHFKCAKMLKCEEVAKAVIYLLSQPEKIHVCELVIRPTGEIL